MAVTISRQSLLAGGLGFLAAALGAFAWTEIGGRTAPEADRPPTQAAAIPVRSDAGQEELLDAMSRIEAALERLDARLAAERARQEVPVSPGSDRDVARQTERLVVELGELVRQLQAAGSPGPIHLDFVERPPGLQHVTLPVLKDLLSDELNAAMQWRTYAEVYESLGPPARLLPSGDGITWEYDHADGSLLGIRFVDGYVVAAWN